MTREIQLTRGFVAIIDAADFEFVTQWQWQANPQRRTVYAQRSLRRTTQMLHSLITGWSLVDHINGDGLDNRRVNLRPASVRENSRNRRAGGGSSIYKGVHLRPSGRWRAHIWIDDRSRYLGDFVDEIEAARAYDTAARTNFGQYAALNFPRPGERPAQPVPDLGRLL